MLYTHQEYLTGPHDSTEGKFIVMIIYSGSQFFGVCVCVRARVQQKTLHLFFWVFFVCFFPFMSSSPCGLHTQDMPQKCHCNA